MRFLARIALLTALSSVMAVVVGVATGTAAHADDTDDVTTMSAYGVTTWSQKSIPGVPLPIPGGVFEHQINGSGLNVSSEWAEFETVWGNVCNWRIEFRYTNLSGAVYARIPGTTHLGCDNVGSARRGIGTLRSGKACARLFVSDTLVVQQCHNIFP